MVLTDISMLQSSNVVGAVSTHQSYVALGLQDGYDQLLSGGKIHIIYNLIYIYI